ncbi:MAG: hypothetical protein DYG93_09585 [Leptolyngbya sp. PLA2]|nr:hypothetical protein [Leptolyngbya sp.]MCE7971895.1 hypothetical protein [Leptolyngbya sp. PL-A2]MCQ3939742.1 hypothetical protein [cyanobacterium CYA1]MDL1903998.1 hypothetical protein [Synechococcales cyanobacterium CNB]GIK18762.1 MAG: hypothetical protein BroJett004_09260 [Planctomycetota bacterium]
MRGRNAFDEVRSILGRLDESITEARRRRLGDPADATTPQPPRMPNTPIPDQHHTRTSNGQTSGHTPSNDRPIGGQPVEEPISPRRAQYGKAKPLRPLNGEAHDHHEQPRRTA